MSGKWLPNHVLRYNNIRGQWEGNEPLSRRGTFIHTDIQAMTDVSTLRHRCCFSPNNFLSLFSLFIL